MVSKERLRHLVIQQRIQIEITGDFVERSIFSPVLAALDDNCEEGTETIRNYLYAIQNGDAEGFVETKTLTGLSYIYSRKQDEASGTLRVMQILHSTLYIISLNAEIAIRAGTLKCPGISIANAIIAASALSVDASVVTNDSHFSQMVVEVIGYSRYFWTIFRNF